MARKSATTQSEQAFSRIANQSMARTLAAE